MRIPARPKVILRSCREYDPEKIRQIIREGLEELGLRPFGRTLVKPNLVAAGPLFPYAYTRPEFGEGVLRALRDVGGESMNELAVGERCGITVPSRVAFRESGWDEMLKNVGVKKYHFEEQQQVEIPLSHPNRLRDYIFTPEPIARADFFVNCPKFKAHPWTTVTFSLKNYIGIQDDRHRLIDHDHKLNEKIADLQHIIQPSFIAIDAITAGEGELFLVGGVESMSRAPFVMAKSESPYSRDMRVFDSTIGSRFPNPRIIKEFGDDTMPQTADNLAKDFSIAREAADKFAYASQQKYANAKGEGFFAGEISPVSLDKGRKAPPEVVNEDEHPRPQTDMAALGKLRALFEGGVTTAGNASGVNDGAAALYIGSLAAGERAGKKPIARILATGAAGVPPRIMGFGPVPASQKALARAGLSIKDMDVIEINEAFAAQVLACLKGLEVDFEDSRVNPNGGAIALGHPLGCSGARIALTAARQLQRSGGRYALASLCIGVGQGMAVVLERM